MPQASQYIPQPCHHLLQGWIFQAPRGASLLSSTDPRARHSSIGSEATDQEEGETSRKLCGTKQEALGWVLVGNNCASLAVVMIKQD